MPSSDETAAGTRHLNLTYLRVTNAVSPGCEPRLSCLQQRLEAPRSTTNNARYFRLRSVLCVVNKAPSSGFAHE